jgi:hypothetical protein
MKIGIIGSGNVGGTLGKRWAALGHQVLFSTRRPDSEEMKTLVASAGPRARATTAAETVAASEILLLATPWPVTREMVESLGELNNRILIDATNPLMPKLAGLEFANTSSGAEQVAQWAKGARVVKAFNTIGDNIMEHTTFGEISPVLFYCGDDKEAKQIAHQLAAELGFDPQNAGPLTQARLLEPFALLWISLAMMQGYGRDIAFQLLKR